jgi:hypothetical protein
MNWTRSKYYKPLLILLAIGLFASVYFSQNGLNRDRAELGLTRKEPLENAPPVLAFTTVALGGFRGLIANALWIRATELQQDGKYFEMVQLADWITKLQPRFTSVWVYQAWNMAYNISIKFQDRHDRWLWVHRGITLLRDQALEYNPNETLLYRELAWFHQHKIGQDLDDAHFYYKRIWAETMQEALGGGFPNYDRLLNPQTPEDEQRVQELVEQYKLEPDHMKEVGDEFGPLDWRLPETHAIYWATLGLKRSTTGELMTLRRAVYQPMQLAFQRGRIIQITDNNLYLGPNLDIIDKTNQAYEKYKQEDEQMREHIGNAHQNFLLMAVYFLYTYDRMDQAQKWFAYLKEQYPDAIPENQDLRAYALSRVGEVVGETSRVRTQAVLEGVLYQAYYNLALQETDRAEKFMEMARGVWKRYMSQVQGTMSEERVGLEPFPKSSRDVRDQFLNPETSPLSDQLRAQLMTALDISEDELPSASSSSSSETEGTESSSTGQ